MASYRFYVACVLLCSMHSVHSYSVKGTIKHMDGAVSEVTVSKYINGKNWVNIQVLTLDRLVGAKTLPKLTIGNFKSINKLELTNIALRLVPVFINTSCEYMYIMGNKITNVPAYAFSRPRPSILDLSNNQIENMADKSVNMGVSELHLRCNKLNHISQSWFEDPVSIRTLNFNGNRIEFIQDRTFMKMYKLHWLYLSNNQITAIGSEAFTTALAVLHLQYNDISQLSPDMFVALDKRVYTYVGDHLPYLYLHHNQLSYLPEALLLKLKPWYISLFGNPWQCQCLRDLERWLRELNSTRLDIPSRRGEPVCVVPVNFQNICVPTVDKELQQTYARGLSPVQGCLATSCQCEPEDLTELT